MSSAQPNPWFTRYALLTAFATLCLIGLGGLVTSHEAGMAVPDWPTSYGYNMFFFRVENWIGGIRYEHPHRLLASLVGLLTTILAIWVWASETTGRQRWLGIAGFVVGVALLGHRNIPFFAVLAGWALALLVIALSRHFTSPSPGLRWLALAAFSAVILQGVLGGLRVAWQRDEIGIFHGTLAQLFFSLICLIALFSSAWWRNHTFEELQARGLQRLYLTVTACVTLQLMLGTTMRHQHAGLAIPDFPTAYGRLWPKTTPDAIARYNQQRVEVSAVKPITAPQIYLQMLHRLMALAILGGVTLVLVLSLKTGVSALFKPALAWFFLTLSQATLGAATIWTNKSADIATLHVVVGALVLAVGALGSAIAWRFPRLPEKNSLAMNQTSADFVTVSSRA